MPAEPAGAAGVDHSVRDVERAERPRWPGAASRIERGQQLPPPVFSGARIDAERGPCAGGGTSAGLAPNSHLVL